MAERRNNVPPLLICPNRPTRNQPHMVYENPVKIGEFSISHNRTFTTDTSELRYYVGPGGRDPPVLEGKIALDLNDGMDVAIFHERTERLDNILQWIETENNRTSINAVDFICRRGLLTKVMMTPFSWTSTWKIAAVGFQGKIYMCEMKTVEDLARNQNEEELRASTFPGFKFEQYVTSDSPDGTPNTTEPVNTNKAYYAVVKSRLNGHRLLFSGEVDSVDKSDNNRIIELNTCIDPHETEKKMNTFKKYKLSRAWAQSYLIGADRIVYGFKDEGGVVRKLKTFQVANIPDYCADVRSWSKQVALYFCDEFLKYVKRTVKDDSNSLVYVFDRRSKADSIYCNIEDEATSECSVLPASYTDAIRTPEEKDRLEKV